MTSSARRLVPIACAALLVALAACGGGGDAAAGGRLQVAVIPKGTTHEFWKAIHAGADRAAAELGVDVIWKGPLKENDRAEQIRLVQQFVSQRVAGIALAPLDFKALVNPVLAARNAGIPVVIFDSALDAEPGRDFASYVATDNTEGGRRGARHLAGLLGGKGKVVLLRYQVGSASTTEREAGFLEVMREHAGIELTVDDVYGGASIDSAKTKALNLIDALRAADGIFCPNESVSVGMLLALQQEGLAGHKKFVGFDASPKLVEGLTAGHIDALVLQDPENMGYLATRTLVQRLRGEQVEPKIGTALAVATRDNLGDPEIRRLLP